MAKVALTIPHSNAAEERVFSVIRKIKRDDKGKLKLEGTVSSLVSVKINMPESKATPFYAFDPPTDLQKKAKNANATSYYNKVVCSSAHSSSLPGPLGQSFANVYPSTLNYITITDPLIGIQFNIKG